MFSLNRVHLIGYQTQAVEVRQTPGGSSVVDLNLVVPYNFKSENGDDLSGKSFHTVTLWGPMADVAGQYVRPGSQLFIAGRLQTDSWDDQTSGEKRSKTKLIGLDMILLDPKDGQTQPPASAKESLSCLNRADVLGNLTKDPELRTTTNGQQVLTLGIATNERWRDKASGENKERTEFHNVVVWGDLATELSQTLRKGQKLFATGRVQTRTWETQTGSKRYTTEIVADAVSMLGVANSVAAGNIESGSASVSAAPEAPIASAPSPSASEEAPVAVPDVKYESEVKPEDLPF